MLSGMTQEALGDRQCIVKAANDKIIRESADAHYFKSVL